MKFNFFWCWSEIGLGVIFAKTPLHPEYKSYLDIYILWLNIWIQLGNRK